MKTDKEADLDIANAQHQQGLVDDVLSFSKLDASMLRLSPKTCLPDSELRNSLKLFTPEFRRQDIDMDYKTDPSYAEFFVSWVKVSFLSMSIIWGPQSCCLTKAKS